MAKKKESTALILPDPKAIVPSDGQNDWPPIVRPYNGAMVIDFGDQDREDLDSFDFVLLGTRLDRVRWPQGTTGGQPLCKSTGGLHGVGDPGGECEACKLKDWGEDRGGPPPECEEVYVLAAQEVGTPTTEITEVHLTKHGVGKFHRRNRRLKRGANGNPLGASAWLLRATIDSKDNQKGDNTSYFINVEKVEPLSPESLETRLAIQAVLLPEDGKSGGQIETF